MTPTFKFTWFDGTVEVPKTKCWVSRKPDGFYLETDWSTLGPFKSYFEVDQIIKSNFSITILERDWERDCTKAGEVIWRKEEKNEEGRRGSWWGWIRNIFVGAIGGKGV